MSEWVLEFPAPDRWLNSNDRTHWRAQVGVKQSWRGAAHVWAGKQKLPRGLVRVRIVATLRFPTNRRRDAHNYMPTLKAVVDGLVDYRLIPDDNDTYLVGPMVQISPDRSDRAYGDLRLDIEEWSR